MTSHITVIGNLGQDAEIKTLPSGKIISVLNVASTPRTKKGDEWVDGETIWYRATYWHQLPSLVYAKGAKVIIVGTLTKNTYTNKDGVEKESLEIRAESVGITHRVEEAAAPSPFDNVVPITSAASLLDEMPF